MDMSAWKRFLFILMLLANSKEFQGKSSSKKGFFPGLMKEEKFDISKCGSYGSLVNLEEENSDWGSETGSEVDFLRPYFPSMIYKRSTLASNIQASNSRISGDVVERDHFPFDVDIDMKEFNYMDDGDEPLFWPPCLKSAWFSEPGSDIFAISPPNKKRKAKSPEKKGIDIIEVEKADLLEVEDVNLDEINADEPLVWPSDRVFDWSSEVAWKFFSMSPSTRKRGEVVENQNNKLEPFKVDKNSTKMMIDFEDLKQNELLVWPADQKLWNLEAVVNLFIMSPLKRRQNREAARVDFSVEEPLFWPSDSAFEWDQEVVRNLFVMSPRRGKVSFESSKGRDVGVNTRWKRNQGMGGVIVSPRVVELRNGSGGSKGVVRTKSTSTLGKRSSFSSKEGIL